MADGKDLSNRIMSDITKKILLVIIAGMVLIIADFAIGSYDNDLLYKDKRGRVIILRPDEGKSAGHMYLKAQVDTDGDTYEKKYEFTVDAYSDVVPKDNDKSDEKNDELSAEENIGYELRSAISAVNDDISARKVILPSSLSTGEKIYWSTERKTNTILILFLVMLACVLVYRSQFSPIKKLRKARLDSITKQLPEFVNKLVLLLNAGLVLSVAFERSVEESLNSRNLDEDYFYVKMREICTNMKEMNSSLNSEFRAFAKESGHSGLMRVSNILSDNISKGVELTDKLQIESEVLWVGRKRDCEERGRVSETKLTLPLVIFLLVLIVITVSPALLEL